MACQVCRLILQSFFNLFALVCFEWVGAALSSAVSRGFNGLPKYEMVDSYFVTMCALLSANNAMLDRCSCDYQHDRCNSLPA